MKALVFLKEPARKLIRLDQKDTPFCVYYSFASCLAWNTWDEMTEKKIIEMWMRLKPWKPSIKIPLIARELSRFYTMHVIDDFEPLLKRWWGIQVYLRPTPEFWLDVSDWKLDWNQEAWDWYDHSVWIHEVDWKLLVENTWKNLPTFDITGRLDELREKWIIAGKWYIFTKND